MIKILAAIIIFAAYTIMLFIGSALLTKLDDSEQEQDDEEQAEYLRKWKRGKGDNV